MGRPHNNPRLIHGTRPSSRPPSTLDPTTMCWPPGMKPTGASNSPAMTTRSRRTTAPDITDALPPMTMSEPSMAAVLEICALPKTTTTSRSTRPSIVAVPAMTAT